MARSETPVGSEPSIANLPPESLVASNPAGGIKAKLSMPLRYVGVSPLAGRREYEFVVPDQEGRHFTISIRDADFSSHQLTFQEAPDLCYQKLRAQLVGAIDIPTDGPIWVTPADLALYRESHKRSPNIRGKWSRPR